MCQNDQKPELESRKRELRSHTHENQEFRSWSHVHEKKSSGAGAVSFVRRLRSPEIIGTVAEHTDVPEKKVNGQIALARTSNDYHSKLNFTRN